jgi:CheY-like chemotaxis protein
MPKMGGLEATRRLAVDPDSPMIILMSIHELSKYRTAALKAGAQYFLAKSELFSELPALMQNLVANRGAQDHWSI